MRIFKKEIIGKTIIKVSSTLVEITIIRNENGNLELEGLGSVTYDMLENELFLSR